jgi:hypothetical protein
MKSFDQLAKAAYNAWHQSHGTHTHQVPFEQLDATYRVHWTAVAQALAAELSAVH